MDTLRNILPGMMKKLGYGQRYKAEMIILNWRQIVGEKIAAHTRPQKISRHILIVSANNPVWAHHLLTVKDDIIARINAFAGEKAVSDLRFQAGYFRNDQNEENGEVDELPAISWREVRLDGRELKIVDSLSAPLADDLLRSKMKRLLSKDLALRKARRRHEWQPCRQCGVLHPPGEELCFACAAAERNEERKAVWRLLQDAPWLSYEECSRYITCRQSDFNAVREKLADTLLRVVSQDEADRIGLPMLTMLLYKVQPQSVTEEMTAKTLAKVRRKSNVSAPRR